jgi:NitT/TauT family transport system substrate-binding protein
MHILIFIFIIFQTQVALSNDIRVAVLKFGSVNWELDVIKYHELDKKNNISISKIEMTNKDAATIAFLSKAADIFITDWIWVSKQRFRGNLVTFTPYSKAAGALMVKNDNTILKFEDLKNKKVGIAGGSLDKSWLFLRAYGIKKYGQDPLKYFKSSFAAPPLINGLLRNNELDAGFNYWNYSARLEAAGFKKLISLEQILPVIGIKGELPLIGYVFRESYEEKNNSAISNFIKASEEARKILKNSNEEWVRIAHLTRANNTNMLEKIRDSFRNGIPSQNNKAMLKNINNAYKILKNIGGKKLVGKSNVLTPGTFWDN